MPCSRTFTYISISFCLHCFLKLLQLCCCPAYQPISTNLAFRVSSNQNQRNMRQAMSITNEHVMSIRCKVSDQDLHHQWQQLAAITPHWLHQIQTVSVYKYNMLCLKWQANNYTSMCIMRFCWFTESNGKLQLGCWLPCRQDIGATGQTFSFLQLTLSHTFALRHVLLKWKPWRKKKHPQFQQYHRILNPNNSVNDNLGIKEGK